MPHKKAKRTVREKLRNEKGEDLAPGKGSLRNEDIPKAALRVFNSQAIRDEYRSKKRKAEEDGGDGDRGDKRRKTGTGAADSAQSKKADKKTDKISSLRIQPGESIQHFNRRVEDDLRPLVKSAVQVSRAVSRNVAKAEHEARLEKKAKAKAKPEEEEEVEKTRAKSPETPTLQIDKFVGRQKEFQSTSSSAPRRLNDIAQAPPQFKKLPRGATTTVGKRDGVLSMAQKVMMEAEREKAILRYRQLKEDRRKKGDLGDKLETDS